MMAILRIHASLGVNYLTHRSHLKYVDGKILENTVCRFRVKDLAYLVMWQSHWYLIPGEGAKVKVQFAARKPGILQYWHGRFQSRWIRCSEVISVIYIYIYILYIKDKIKHKLQELLPDYCYFAICYSTHCEKWWHRSESSLPHVKACCLKGPRILTPKQGWLIVIRQRVTYLRNLCS